MKTNLKVFVQCLFFIGIIFYSGCSKDVVKISDTGLVSSSGLKSGSTDILIQTFTLSGGTWSSIQSAAGSYGSAGFTRAWLPPCSKSADTYGYLPTEWYTYSNNRGTASQLSSCISAFKSAGMSVIADVVVNHRCGTATSGSDFTNPSFSCNSCAVVSGDECGCGSGSSDTGDGISSARDLDHTNSDVQTRIKEYITSMKSLGFTGWRYDMVKGYGASYVSSYASHAGGFNVGEYWDGSTSNLNSWVNSSGINAFDFATYYSLQSAINNSNYSYLSASGIAPGLIGVNPSHAVTFAGNHDTESVGLLGNVYILTHPGIPCIFVNDWNSYSSAITTLISIRKSQGINQTSTVSVQSATTSVYAAIIDGKVAMKIGPGSWSPTGSWTLATSGTNYAVWTSGGSSSNVTVTLRMLKDVGYGNSLFFSGDNSALTNWGTGVQGTWSTGNYWTCPVTVASGTAINFKTRLGTTGGVGVTWESGDNHNIPSPVDGTTYTVTFNGGF